MIVNVLGRDIDLGPKPSNNCVNRFTATDPKYSPEPETVEWIKSLPASGTFLDVGANAGRFSVMAAVRGLEVYAFEMLAEFANELVEITGRNNLPIHIIIGAVRHEEAYGKIGRGRSKYQFHPTHRDTEAPLLGSFTLDSFIATTTIKPPYYLKIDVDGDEMLVLMGAERTLEMVESALIEVDPQVPGHASIPSIMDGHGFRFDREQVESCRIKEGKYKGTANYIFRRKL